MFKSLAFALAAPALLMSLSAAAESDRDARADLFYAQSQADTAAGSEDFSGYGLRLQGEPVQHLLMRAEASHESIDDGDQELELIRVGLGPTYPVGLATAYGLLEFDQLRTRGGGAGSDSQGGVGGIVGAAISLGPLTASTEAGWISLDDLDGPYLGADFGYAFASSHTDSLGFFLAYRKYWLDNDGADADLGQLQMGLRYTY